MEIDAANNLAVRLKGAENYREFLKFYIECKGLSLASVARAAGFSRGFPGDVISGKRRLTVQSAIAFEKAMKIPATGRKFFRFLVARDEPGLFPDLNPKKVTSELENLRAASWAAKRRNTSENLLAGPRRLFQDPEITALFASCGTSDSGATSYQLKTRTGILEPNFSIALSALLREGLIRNEHDRFFPCESHLFFKTVANSPIFQTLYARMSQNSVRRSETQLASESEMFFTSTFCVREDRLPALKSSLRELILQFVDDAIDPGGDRVAYLLTSLHL